MAAGFGDIQVYSRIGDPLRVEIPLIGESAQWDASCLRTLGPDQLPDDGLPVVWHGRLKVIQHSGRPYVQFVSNTPVNDPALLFGVMSNCGVRIARHFTILPSAPLDAERIYGTGDLPPVEAETDTQEARPDKRVAPALELRVRSGASIQTLAISLHPGNPAAQRHFVRRLEKANPEFKGRMHDILTEDIVLNIPRESPRASPRPALKLTPAIPATASALPQSTTTRRQTRPAKPRSAGQRDRVFIEPTPGLEFLPPDNAEEARVLINAKLADSELNLYKVRRQISMLQSKGGERTPDLLALESRLASIQTSLEAVRQSAAHPPELRQEVRPEPLTPAPIAPPLLQPVSQPQPQPEPEPVPVPPPAPAPLSKDNFTWLALLSVLGLSALLAFLIGRRKLQAIAITKKIVETQRRARNQPGLRQPESPFPAGIPIPTPGSWLEEERHTAAEVGEVTDGLEMADLLLSAFGRPQAAADILLEFSAAHPRDALRPWINLLEIYRGMEMREEFEALSANLNQHFNVARVEWQDSSEYILSSIADSSADPSRPQSIEEIPHIAEHICHLWGKAECAVYLRKILINNRDGKREGFSIPIVQEILFLQSLLELILSNH